MCDKKAVFYSLQNIPDGVVSSEAPVLRIIDILCLEGRHRRLEHVRVTEHHISNPLAKLSRILPQIHMPAQDESSVEIADPFPWMLDNMVRGGFWRTQLDHQSAKALVRVERGQFGIPNFPDIRSV